MAEISVQKRPDAEGPFRFDVTVSEESSETRHEVTLRRDDYDRWSGGASPEAFVERCFEFLIEREPKESILSRFDVRDIGRYFPDFESEIARS